jgi:hypothetical protein
MPDEKDRLGDKLKDAERAREDQYFAERDRRLMEKLRGQPAVEPEAGAKAEARMRCPKCGEALLQKVVQGITLEECSGCKGIWLDAGEFEELSKREHEGWLGRLLRVR